MEKKYEMLEDDTVNINNTTLYRIRALRDFEDVKKGDLGGYVQSEHNLSHEGNAWVYDNARVYGDAEVYDNAKVYRYAEVFGNAWVRGNANVYGYARVYGDAQVYDNAQVAGIAQLRGNANVCGNTWVFGDAQISRQGDCITLSGFGSAYRTTTIYRTKSGIEVQCGCFNGTLEEFRKRAQKTHGDNRFAKEYLMIADLAELHFKEEE